MDSHEFFKNIMNKYYVTREISDKKELKKILNENIDQANFDALIQSTIKSKDEVFIGRVLFVGYLLNMISEKHQGLFKNLLGMDWHKRHEDIAESFQKLFNSRKENINTLKKAINSIPNYLEPDDFKYPYIRKLIYAIGAQPEPYNFEALEELARSEDEKIKDLALHQIEKRKQYGRWENEKD